MKIFLLSLLILIRKENLRILKNLLPPHGQRLFEEVDESCQPKPQLYQEYYIGELETTMKDCSQTQIQVKLRKPFRSIGVVAKPDTATDSNSPIQMKTHQLYQQTQRTKLLGDFSVLVFFLVLSQVVTSYHLYQVLPGKIKLL